MYLCYVNDELVFLYITMGDSRRKCGHTVLVSWMQGLHIMLFFVTEPMTVCYARLRFKVRRKFWIYVRPHRFLLGEALRASWTLQHSEERRSVVVVV